MSDSRMTSYVSVFEIIFDHSTPKRLTTDIPYLKSYLNIPWKLHAAQIKV